LIIIGTNIIRHALAPRTVLTQSKVITQYFSGGDTPTQQITERTFSVVLPLSWHTASNPGSPYTIFSWQGTGADADRRIDIYLDNVPPSLSVNRLLPVQVNLDQLQPLGTVSDNCTTFTTPTAQSAQTGTIDAKWNGVNFLCDTGNYERDVVAIGSSSGTISLTGPKTGIHKIMLVYTDNTTQPDYSIFTSIVESFRIN
jgi:hypothetical protein